LKEFGSCPYCGSERFGRVQRNFYKCYQCKREWSIRKGGVLEGLKIPLHKFVLALKLFELEVPALRASKELELAYNTVHKFFQLIRKKIYQQSEKKELLEGEVEADESSFGGKGKANGAREQRTRSRSLGSWSEKGKVKVEVTASPKILWPLSSNLSLLLERKRNGIN